MSIEILVNVLVIVGFVLLMFYLYKRGKVLAVKRTLYELVAKCEVLISIDDGDDINYDLIIDKVYPKLPLVIRTFMTPKELDTLLHKYVGELKSYLQVNRWSK